MANIPRIFLLMILIAALPVLPAPPALAQVDRTRSGIGGAADAAKGVQRASCVLQLDYEPNRGGPRTVESQTLNALLTSTSLVDPAAKAALGLGPDAWPRVAQIELLPAGQVAVKLSVVVTPAKDVKLPDSAAQAFLDELTARAKAAVDQAAERQEQAAAERRASLEKDLAAAQERLVAAQSKLREARAAAGTGGAGAFGGVGTEPAGRGIAQEMQQIEVNLAASRARLKVIEEEIEKLAAKGAAATTRPDVKSIWTELVDARQRAVEAARNAPETHENRIAIARAEAELAEAKIRAAAAASDAAARPAPFDSPDRWQGERITLRASIAEQEARLGALSERLAAATSGQKSTTTQPLTQYDVERLQREEHRARQEVDELTQQLDQLRRERRGAATAPRLLILDGRAGGSAGGAGGAKE